MTHETIEASKILFREWNKWMRNGDNKKGSNNNNNGDDEMFNVFVLDPSVKYNKQINQTHAHTIQISLSPMHLKTKTGEKHLYSSADCFFFLHFFSFLYHHAFQCSMLNAHMSFSIFLFHFLLLRKVESVWCGYFTWLSVFLFFFIHMKRAQIEVVNERGVLMRTSLKSSVQFSQRIIQN